MEEHCILILIFIVVKYKIIHFKITLQIVMEEHYIFPNILIVVKY
jgi:hypothetical protein